jgi:predicted RecA/RadA family phage recombinase
MKVGHFYTDGKAIDATAADSTVVSKGDLYRMGGWNGIAMKNVAAADTDRGLALETSAERVWKVKLPAGVTPAVGDVLYWSTNSGQKAGADDLVASPPTGAAPCCKVLVAKNAAGYAAVRVLNIGAGFTGT